MSNGDKGCGYKSVVERRSCSIVRGGLSEKFSFKKDLKEEVRELTISIYLGKSIPGKGNSKCKRLEACLRKSKGGRILGNKVTKIKGWWEDPVVPYRLF